MIIKSLSDYLCVFVFVCYLHECCFIIGSHFPYLVVCVCVCVCVRVCVRARVLLSSAAAAVRFMSTRPTEQQQLHAFSPQLVCACVRVRALVCVSVYAGERYKRTYGENTVNKLGNIF